MWFQICILCDIISSELSPSYSRYLFLSIISSQIGYELNCDFLIHFSNRSNDADKKIPHYLYIKNIKIQFSEKKYRNQIIN